jgi:hypothetical protein
LGEDDLLLNDAIENAVTVLKKDKPKFVMSNYVYLSDNQERIIGSAFHKDVAATLFADDFIANNLITIGFIGSCIIATDSWKNTHHSPYLKTYFTHVGRIIEMLELGDQISVLQTPNVGNRAQGADTFTWKNDSFGVFFGFEKMCLIASIRKPHFKNNIQMAIKLYKKKNRHFNALTLLRLRAEGMLDKNQYDKYIKNSKLNAIKRNYAHFLCYMPKSILGGMLKFYRAINN